MRLRKARKCECTSTKRGEYGEKKNGRTGKIFMFCSQKRTICAQLELPLRSTPCHQLRSGWFLFCFTKLIYSKLGSHFASIRNRSSCRALICPSGKYHFNVLRKSGKNMRSFKLIIILLNFTFYHLIFVVVAVAAGCALLPSLSFASACYNNNCLFRHHAFCALASAPHSAIHCRYVNCN